jgi:hypothetical protein
VAKLLDAGVDINAASDDGQTALMVASRSGYTEIVELLLAKDGIDVDMKDEDGYTALIWASEGGHAEIVAKLLKKKAKKNVKTNMGQTALYWAENNGHTNIVNLLKGIKLKPPPCMSQTEYEKCIPGWDDPKERKKWTGDEKPTCGISLENIERKEDAVKLTADALIKEPNKEAPKGQPNVCYDRKTLKQWFNNSKTNPHSREKVKQTWIDANMGDQDCEPQTESAPEIAPETAPETVFNIPSKGGKRKSKRKSKRKIKRKTRKSKRNLYR